MPQDLPDVVWHLYECGECNAQVWVSMYVGHQAPARPRCGSYSHAHSLGMVHRFTGYKPEMQYAIDENTAIAVTEAQRRPPVSGVPPARLVREGELALRHRPYEGTDTLIAPDGSHYVDGRSVTDSEEVEDLESEIEATLRRRGEFHDDCDYTVVRYGRVRITIEQLEEPVTDGL
jgi:hypothetical protein